MTTSVLPLLFLSMSSHPFFVMMAVTLGLTSCTSLLVLVLLSLLTAIATRDTLLSALSLSLAVRRGGLLRAPSRHWNFLCSLSPSKAAKPVENAS